MTDSSIEWTQKTWNVLRGCSRVSAGCEHCYAESVAARFSGLGLPYEGLARRRSNGQPQWTGVVKFVESKLLEPMKWREPKRVFVNSMSDLFHEKVIDETLDRIFAVMALTPRHTFQILTKRPDRMRRYLCDPGRLEAIYAAWSSVSGTSPEVASWPLPNVHVGTSIEDQPTADERIPHVLQTPAVVRFISAEPLLADVDLSLWLEEDGYIDDQYVPPLDWVIVGGESGHGARPLDIAWIAHVVADCRANNVPVFVKQLGAVPMMSEVEWQAKPNRLLSATNRNRVPEGFVPLKLYSKKGGVPLEWPEDVRVREFPAVTRVTP